MLKMELANKIDMSTTDLIENERVLAEDRSRFTFELYVATSVYGSKHSMQDVVSFWRSKFDASRVIKTLYFITYDS
jgi:hypothetical protein